MPTYVITGANRGLGLEFVAQQASKKIIAASHSLSSEKVKGLESLKSRNTNIQLLGCDTSSIKSVTSFASEVTSLLGAQGKIDYLLNNAGINSVPDQTSLSLAPECLQEQITVNVLGPPRRSKLSRRTYLKDP
jgi:NAD(P)-dependent dehydrogenase (short-subunit alcohol dehydrogenase family)